MKHKKHSPIKRKVRYGDSSPPPDRPLLTSPIETYLGMTYKGYKDHVMKTPPGFMFANLQGPLSASSNVKGSQKPHNFYYNQRLLGTSSLPPYAPTKQSTKHKFGQYFH